eukprot:CAMPEP_0177163524 /NCGR_PEP_ID=MMETSP0367-20130122/6459_1 /TAXON_ID=447022 ORGANISM="Scrippsiella hangoei-like, Strain SHHI-4" /NCGR_SAMPLE_ID=MMETSP0367 /ASSEMBLY_ACC=CAM_ASM_000362 /LENGTH=154 /DNA_ID=CAMNT_0018609357 /DNA_START=23 /DNA_END=488 /DNA_ORIENTATION=+
MKSHMPDDLAWMLMSLESLPLDEAEADDVYAQARGAEAESGGCGGVGAGGPASEEWHEVRGDLDEIGNYLLTHFGTPADYAGLDTKKPERAHMRYRARCLRQFRVDYADMDEACPDMDVQVAPPRPAAEMHYQAGAWWIPEMEGSTWLRIDLGA